MPRKGSSPSHKALPVATISLQSSALPGFEGLRAANSVGHWRPGTVRGPEVNRRQFRSHKKSGLHREARIIDSSPCDGQGKREGAPMSTCSFTQAQAGLTGYACCSKTDQCAVSTCVMVPVCKSARGRGAQGEA